MTSARIHAYRFVLVSTMVAVFVGCIEREGRPVNPCTNVTVAQAIQVTNVDKVDVLFMVDNSNSMTEEQANLTAEFPRMVQILTTGDFDQNGSTEDEVDFDPVTDLQIGVITSDMGTGGFTVPTCSRPDGGDDGRLRTEGRVDMAGCAATYDTFLNFRPDSGASSDDFARDVSCVATVGTGGCGFEQQLEAILKAVSPSAPTTWTADGYIPPDFQGQSGHADGVNAGFVRDDSVLAIIPVTDEEDCSARDLELFNPSGPYTGDLNLRCYTHSTAALHPTSRYVDGFLQLRRRPGLLIYAPIVGIPEALAPGEDNFTALVGDESVRDPSMIEEIDPDMPNRLRPSCNTAQGLAFPPIRLVQVAQGLQSRGAGVTVQSICAPSFRNALTEIIAQIRSALGAACLPRALNLESDGTVACDVLAIMPEGMGCDALPGSEAQVVDGTAVVEDGRAVCKMLQRVPASRAPGSALPADPGWVYDDFSPEGAENCQEGTDPYQRIAFTSQPPSGATVRLECFLTVQDEGDAAVSIGTFCDPNSDTVCPTGQSPGGTALTCDPVSRTCGVACSTSADCRSAGLVGYVCDDRELQQVDSSFEGNTTPYNICVNPTCG